MKLANVSWGWTPIPEDMPHGDSLIRIADQIRELGFEGVDSRIRRISPARSM